jgi:6-phosphogluconolactonase
MTEPSASGTIGSPGRGDEPAIIVRPTPEAVSALAADLIVASLRGAIAERGRAHFATTGGSSPIGIYSVLASTLRDRVDWSRVEFWWGDDRFVPRDHALSNVQAADAILFDSSQFAGQSGNLVEGIDVQEELEPGLSVPAANIHPFPCGEAIAHARGTDWCAARYAELIRGAGLPLARGYPVFDVFLVGVGTDGHLLSVFPGSDAFDRAEWTMAVPAPTHIEPHVPRVTMNPAILGVARTVLTVVTGATKADAIGRIFSTERDVRSLPAQLVRRSGATWILDAAAAAQLPAEAATA